MNILHLVHDDKFINFVVDLFHSCSESNNRFLVVVDNPNHPFKHILLQDGIYKTAATDLEFIKENMEWAECLVIHYLDPKKALLAASASKDIPILWSGWGGDYFSLLPNADDWIVGDKTKALVGANKRVSYRDLMNKAKREVRERLDFIKYGDVIKEIIPRINYFSSPVPEDFSLLREELKNFRAEYAQINYCSVEKTFSAGLDLSGSDILIGNSATPSNNHAEIFDRCSNLDLTGRKLIVPLSYGDVRYRDLVVKMGEEKFGEKFVPLIDFMPLEKYNEVIANCSVAIMGHRRQQAVANIGTMLYKGAKLFMDQSSTVYQHMIACGMHIFSLEGLDSTDSNVFSPLSQDEKNRNRQILEKEWGHEVVVKNAELAIGIMFHERKHVPC